MTYHIHDLYGASVCPACTPAPAPASTPPTAAGYRRRLIERLENVIYLHMRAQTAIYQHETYNLALRLAAFAWGCDVAPLAVSAAMRQGKRNGIGAARAALRRVEKMHGGENAGERGKEHSA